MSTSDDFLDALLVEWFGESSPSCPHSSVPSPLSSCEDSVPASVLDFDLSLLEASSVSARRAQEVVHGRALKLLALAGAHVATPIAQECIHSPLLPSVCPGLFIVF